MPLSCVFRGPRALFAPLALLLLLIPASSASAKSSLPTITDVSPLKAQIGDKLTIKGSRFVPGKQTNIVVFKRDGKPAVFVKADSATRSSLSVTIPEKLGPFLVDGAGAPGGFAFRLRILAAKFGRAFTATKDSPVIRPKSGAGGDPTATTECAAGKTPTDPNGDADGDGMTNADEAKFHTDPCKLDSDGDGISDTFEVYSALDLNLKDLPYPGKKPYPNALDGSDAGFDFDQDGLSMKDEYALWMYSGGKLPLTYSDGSQDTGGPTLTTAATTDLDMDHNGVLTDDEKDADHDGLGNWDESHGRMTPEWWGAIFPGERPYSGAAGSAPMLTPSMVDPDSDGDGVLDGADDQDHDGIANLDEIDRYRVADANGMLWVNPYNPCLPDYKSRVCTLHPPISSPWAPFPITATTPAPPLHWSPTPVVGP